MRCSVCIVVLGVVTAIGPTAGAAPFYSIDHQSPTAGLVSDGDVVTPSGTGQVPPPAVVIPFGAGGLGVKPTAVGFAELDALSFGVDLGGLNPASLGSATLTLEFDVCSTVGQNSQTADNVPMLTMAFGGTQPAPGLTIGFNDSNRLMWSNSSGTLQDLYWETFTDPEDGLGWHKAYFDNFNGSSSSVPVPEPSTFFLATLGLLGLCFYAYRHRPA